MIIILLSACPLAFAGSLDLSVNNNAAELQFDTSPVGDPTRNSDIHVGVLYNSSSMNALADAGLLVKGEVDTGLIIALGAKALAGEIKNYVPGTTLNVMAITIGGEIKYVLPAVKQLSVALYYFGAPSVVTFGDADRADQWGVHLDYEIAHETKIYVEYRESDFGIKTTGQTAVLDNGAFIGVRLAF
jgi:predicted porin